MKLKLAILILLFNFMALFAQDNAGIVVYADSVTATRASNPIGINLNYLRDPDAVRPAGSVKLNDALQNFNGKWLRYPGGRKSVFYRFAKPPYTKPDPQVSDYYRQEIKEDIMDFDEFMNVVKATKTNPFVVVAYNPEEIVNGNTTLQEYIDHAKGWVAYAKKHKSKVVYWEIGNENWGHFKGYTWAQVIKDVLAIAKAMKEIDATIKVGTSFNSDEQLIEMLDIADSKLDFLTISNYYPSNDRWNGQDYSFYESGGSTNTIRFADTYTKELKKRNLSTELIIAETNAKQ